MKLYFGNTVTAVTTIMILALTAFIAVTVHNRADIQHWGVRIAFLLVFGLVICCFATARDGLDKTIQYTIDGSCAPGIFKLVSVPTIVGCIGALIIIVSAVAAPVAKTQAVRRIWFFVMTSGVFLKIAVMEISRIFMHI